MADKTKFVDIEEAFICALYHTFGKIMVAFYMPEKIEEMAKLCAEKGYTEDLSAMSALGVSWDPLSMRS